MVGLTKIAVWSWVVTIALGGCAGTSSGADAGATAGPDAGIATARMCPPGEYMRGIDATGAAVCEPLTLPSITCPANQFVVGIDDFGNAVCQPSGISTDLIRDYVNDHCYLYVGWRDSCDDCLLAPVKLARTRGADTGCTAEGANSACATMTLFGHAVQMAGLNTDGDVNDDDKFWFGLKCE